MDLEHGLTGPTPTHCQPPAVEAIDVDEWICEGCTQEWVLDRAVKTWTPIQWVQASEPEVST